MTVGHVNLTIPTAIYRGDCTYLFIIVGWQWVVEYHTWPWTAARWFDFSFKQNFVFYNTLGGFKL